LHQRLTLLPRSPGQRPRHCFGRGSAHASTSTTDPPELPLPPDPQALTSTDGEQTAEKPERAHGVILPPARHFLRVADRQNALANAPDEAIVRTPRGAWDCVLLTGCSSSDETARRRAFCCPAARVVGVLTGGSGIRRRLPAKPLPDGWVEEEYAVEGTAVSYD
jgi:hypothetical protein